MTSIPKRIEFVGTIDRCPPFRPPAARCDGRDSGMGRMLPAGMTACLSRWADGEARHHAFGPAFHSGASTFGWGVEKLTCHRQ